MLLPALALLLTGNVSSAFVPPPTAGGSGSSALLIPSVALLLTLVVLARRAPEGPADVLVVAVQPERDTGWMTRPLWLFLALLLGAGLRLHRLGEGLWFDEIQTLVEYVRLPLGSIVTTYDSQNQHLFYTLLAKFSTLALGEGAFSLRLPAALLGVASLWAMYRFAREIVPAGEAFLATLILTVSYHHVWFSQNARGYTGLLLGTLVGTWALWRLLSEPRAGGAWIALYAISMALAAYTHVTAALVSAAHLVIVATLAVIHRKTGGWRRPAFALALSAGIGLVLYSPVLGQFIGTLLAPSPDAASTEWQHPLWLLAETASGLARGLPGGWIGLVLGAGVAGTGVVSFARRSPPLLALMVLPGVLTAAIMVGLGHNLWPRFFFFSAGFGVLIAVRGVYALAELVFHRHGPTTATIVLALVAAASALSVPGAWGPKQDYGGAASYIGKHRGPGDAIYTADLTFYPFNRYLGENWPELAGAEALVTAERQHPRTWVLYTFPIRLAAVMPEVWERLQASYDTAAVFPGTVGGGDIVVMVHSSAKEPN